MVGMLPNPSDIQYFIEIAKTLNLTRASEQIGIQQPSLTSAMKRLEQAVGKLLFTRSPRGVSLTKAGCDFLQYAQQLLFEWKKLKLNIERTYEEVAGRFSLGCHPSVAQYSLPCFMSKLLLKYEKLEIQLVHGLSREITQGVLNKKMDIGIVVNPVAHPELIIRKIYNDEVKFWTRKNKTPLQEARSGSGVLIFNPEFLQAENLLRQAKKFQIKFKRVLESVNFEVITELISSGCGFGILPSTVALQWEQRGLKEIENTPKLRDQISLIYRVENREIKAIQTIAHTIEGTFAGKEKLSNS